MVLLTTRAVAAVTMLAPFGAPAIYASLALYSGLRRFAADPVVRLDAIGSFFDTLTPALSGTPAGFFSVEVCLASAGNLDDVRLSMPFFAELREPFDL